VPTISLFQVPNIMPIDVLFLLGRAAAERETTIFLHGPVVKSKRARILGATIDYTRIVQDRGEERNL